MSISLTVATLSAASICDVVIQLAFLVADDKVPASNVSLFEIARMRHHHCGVCLVLMLVSGHEPAWSLPLYQLGIIGSNAMGDFR